MGPVKHLTGAEAPYFGATYGRPFDATPLWCTGDAEPNADLWAQPDESRQDIVGRYRTAWAHSDETIARRGSGRTAPTWRPGTEPLGRRTRSGCSGRPKRLEEKPVERTVGSLLFDRFRLLPCFRAKTHPYGDTCSDVPPSRPCRARWHCRPSP
ncbi:mycothiol transferase [Streptomyces sp. NPDC002078]